MKIIGITGGVGAGKSTILDYLSQKYDAYVIQADKIGHLVMEPGGLCYEHVIALFGRQIIKNDKTIDRKQVSDVVFGNELMRQSLDAIIHPAVKAYILEEIRKQRQAGCRLLVMKQHFFWKNITRNFVTMSGIFIRMQKSVFGV